MFWEKSDLISLLLPPSFLAFNNTKSFNFRSCKYLCVGGFLDLQNLAGGLLSQDLALLLF